MSKTKEESKTTISLKEKFLDELEDELDEEITEDEVIDIKTNVDETGSDESGSND